MTDLSRKTVFVSLAGFLNSGTNTLLAKLAFQTILVGFATTC
jgi:hypothetical protein